MKNLLVKLTLAGAVLASALPAASAATRRPMQSNTAHYGAAASDSQAGWNSRWVDDEQARRDIENAGG